MSSEPEEEMSPDIKNDILLAFNLYKNEKGKINKLKLRTMLFSFVMYKSAPNDINAFIEDQTSPEQEYFTYDEVVNMIQVKIKYAKEKEADDIFTFMAGKRDVLSEERMKKALDNFQIGLTNSDVKEMFQFILHPEEGDEKSEEVEEKSLGNTSVNVDKSTTTQVCSISREDFKNFYTDFK